MHAISQCTVNTRPSHRHTIVGQHVMAGYIVRVHDYPVPMMVSCQSILTGQELNLHAGTMNVVNYVLRQIFFLPLVDLQTVFRCSRYHGVDLRILE